MRVGISCASWRGLSSSGILCLVRLCSGWLISRFGHFFLCFRLDIGILDPIIEHMKTLDQIITEAAEHISANRSLLVVAQLKEIIRHAIEEAFDSRLYAEMEAQDAWWDEQELEEEMKAQEEGWTDPDEKADPDCPEEFACWRTPV